MSSHALIQSTLAGHAGLAALVGTRIRADLAEPADAYPFVVFKRSDYEESLGLDDSVQARRETFQIECWGATRSQSVDVSEQVFAALRAGGIPGSGADPDGIDPEVLARAVVVSTDVWT